MSAAITWSEIPTRITKEQWIRAVMTDADLGPCIALACVHMVNDVPGREVYSCKFGPTPRDPADIAKEIDQKSAFYCQDLPGTQTFCLTAWFRGADGQANREPQRFLPFTKTGQPGQMGLLTEGPDDKGQKSQGMRHIEVMGGMWMRGNMNVQETQTMLIGELMRDRREMARENRDAWVSITEMIVRQATDNRAHEMEKLKFQRASEERQMLLRFLPAVVNEAAGKELIPNSSLDSVMIDRLCDTMTPEKLKMMAESGVFPDEMIVMIATRVKQRWDKRKEEEAAKEANQKSTGEAAAKSPLTAEAELDGGDFDDHRH